jgi:hypothetical protein
MTKKEVQKRVLQNGEPLDLDKFEWDEKTNTFSSNEDGLVLDFKEVGICTFKTGSYCTFDTDSYCTFKTGSNCTFDTGYDCTFDTGPECVVIRRDIYEVIELKEGQKIKLREYGVKGYDIVETEKPTGKLVKIKVKDQIIEGELVE